MQFYPLLSCGKVNCNYKRLFINFVSNEGGVPFFSVDQVKIQKKVDSGAKKDCFVKNRLGYERLSLLYFSSEGFGPSNTSFYFYASTVFMHETGACFQHLCIQFIKGVHTLLDQEWVISERVRQAILALEMIEWYI